jgi:hypothetical protein
MPNHVSHICAVTGPAEDLLRFKAELFGACTPNELFDFGRIIPMPDILKGSDESSTAEFGLQLVIARASNTHSFFDKNIAIPDVHWARMCEETGATHAGEVASRYLGAHPDWEEAGTKRLHAIAETGFAGWHSWAIANWGTKWGSYSVAIKDWTPEHLIFEFQTAWSFPAPIFDALTARYPTLTFDLKVFDEGWNFAMQGQLGAVVSDPLKTVEPTAALYEAVYGEPPEREDAA